MNYPLVSIIIPVYNVKAFLVEGLQRVLLQNYPNYEVLLVDDGATDGSGTLCDELAGKHGNVQAIHKPNGGSGSARNLGVSKAKGEYIYMYDIDDACSPNLLSYCVDKMETLHLDLLVFSFRTIETAYNNRRQDIVLPERLIESNAGLRDAWLDCLVLVPNGNGFVWNKVYRRSFLQSNKLTSSVLAIQQDEEFNLRVYQHVQRAYISSEVLYDYYIYEKGNNRSRFIADRFDIYKTVYGAFRHLQHAWHLNDPRLDSYLYRRFWGNVLQCLIYNMHQSKCPWTREMKQKEFQRIAQDDITLQAIDYLRGEPGSLENRLYRYAIANKKAGLLSIVAGLFNRLRALKHML